MTDVVFFLFGLSLACVGVFEFRRARKLNRESTQLDRQVSQIMGEAKAYQEVANRDVKESEKNLELCRKLIASSMKMLRDETTLDEVTDTVQNLRDKMNDS